MADLRMLKFPLFDMSRVVDDKVTIQAPHGCGEEFIGMQCGVIMLWALSNGVHFPRHFHVRGTGQVLGLPEGCYVGTVFDRSFVWHIFETLEVHHA